MSSIVENIIICTSFNYNLWNRTSDQTLTYHLSKKHASSRPLNKPRIPCGNSVIKKSKRTATNSIVVRSVRRWHFEGLCLVRGARCVGDWLCNGDDNDAFSVGVGTCKKKIIQIKVHRRSMSHFTFCMPMACSDFRE